MLTAIILGVTVFLKFSNCIDDADFGSIGNSQMPSSPDVTPYSISAPNSASFPYYFSGTTAHLNNGTMYYTGSPLSTLLTTTTTETMISAVETHESYTGGSLGIALGLGIFIIVLVVIIIVVVVVVVLVVLSKKGKLNCCRRSRNVAVHIPPTPAEALWNNYNNTAVQFQQPQQNITYNDGQARVTFPEHNFNKS